MAGLVHIQWYATVGRKDDLAEEISWVAALALRYGAWKYSVQRSQDDRYKITQMAWFEEKNDWYRYWEGPDMTAFRRRNSSRYQIPITYTWYEELATGELGPEVPLPAAPPEPEPEPETEIVAG
jgi:hypothetical protein